MKPGERHRRFVAHHYCIACANGRLAPAIGPVCQAAHLRHLGKCGMGMKPSDVLTVPLCLRCHDEYDGRRKGKQGAKFWEGRDPMQAVKELAKRSPVNWTDEDIEKAVKS